jgi:hypothetical protein
MLSEAVIAGATKLASGRSGRKLSPSIVSTCPMKTYKNWKREERAVSGQDLLRMNDGHYQEQEMIDDLERAGFKIKDRQREVHIGGVMVGHIDGLILVDGKWHDLSCKAMSLERFTNFRQRGFASEPAIRCQEMSYLASDELQWENVVSGFVYAKHKDTCRPYDLYFEFGREFANGIIDQVKRLLEGYIPEPKRIGLCIGCSDRLDCWKSEIVDMTGVKVISMPEMVEKWKQGRYFAALGKELNEESREAFEKELGNLRVITIEDLKVQRLERTTSGISYEKFVSRYGAAALADVWDEKTSFYMRVDEIEV